MGGTTTRRLLLAGQYEPLDLLGSGGRARVIRGYDHHHARFVALKIRPAGGATERAAATAEAEALAAVAVHPNVAMLRHHFFDGDDHVIVMDHVEGEDLAAKLRRGAVDATDALGWLDDIAAALDHLHRSSVVHGDVKPANIVLAKRGAVLVGLGAPDPTGYPSRESDLKALARMTGELLGTSPR